MIRGLKGEKQVACVAFPTQDARGEARRWSGALRGCSPRASVSPLKWCRSPDLANPRSDLSSSTRCWRRPREEKEDGGDGGLGRRRKMVVATA
uniref:Uncharacterized protein n=1 Tax=Oryza rufipogon TaxID=4529 RepID=A0A0E0QEZ8_ORYRU